MKKSVSKIKIENELDVVLAYKRAIQLSSMTGMPVATQTKIGTAISEVCRNVLEHAVNGSIEFKIIETEGRLWLEALVEDRGKGIVNVEEILKGSYTFTASKGFGIINSKKLVDKFHIESKVDFGTKVFLSNKIPLNHPPINNSVIEGWIEYFNKENSVSPYEEIKKQNMNLLDLVERLRLKNIEVEHQVEEITYLNNNLEVALGEVKLKNDALFRVNEVLDDFVYTVAHDLKSPVSNLKLLISHIQKNKDEGRKEEYIQNLHSSVKRLDQTIDSLIEIIQIQGEGNTNNKKISFIEILNTIKEEFKETLIEKEVAIREQIECDTINYIEAYIHSILFNLISNSIKYSSTDRKPKISILVKKEDEFVVVSVADNGIGINLEYHQKNMFTPFKRFTTQAQGKGIGLYLINSMVRRNGGRIEVKSEVNVGTTFNLYLKEY